MAILFITHKFPPSIGGMQKQSYELINGMREKAQLYTLIQQPGECKLLFLLSIRGRVKSMLKQHPDINVVHCNDGTVASFCTWLTAYSDVKVTATIHGLDITFPNYFYQKWIVPKIAAFDRIFAVSLATAQVCIDKGFDPDKVVPIQNGVDTQSKDVQLFSTLKHKLQVDFGIDLDRDKILLSIGRPVRRKGFSWFAKEVLPLLPDGYKYVVAGPGSTSRLMEIASKILPSRWSRQLELATGYATDAQELKHIDQSNFIYLDQLPYDELVQLIGSAHLMLMPNIEDPGDMEGFGLVALEAGLHNTYVVASRLQGITSAIVDGNNGILVPSEDVQPWVSAILSLRDGDFVDKEAQYARAYIQQHFGWDKMIDEYAEEFAVMADVVDNRKSLSNVYKFDLI